MIALCVFFLSEIHLQHVELKNCIFREDLRQIILIIKLKIILRCHNELWYLKVWRSGLKMLRAGIWSRSKTLFRRHNYKNIHTQLGLACKKNRFEICTIQQRQETKIKLHNLQAARSLSLMLRFSLPPRTFVLQCPFFALACTNSSKLGRKKIVCIYSSSIRFSSIFVEYNFFFIPSSLCFLCRCKFIGIQPAASAPILFLAPSSARLRSKT